MRHIIGQMDFQLDKATYYTVAGAILTIYGVFLACIQFIAGSENSNSEEVSQYMGMNIRAFYLNYHLKVLRVAKSLIFELMMGYCILFKLIIKIMSDFITHETEMIFYLTWFGFVTFYFLFFLILFFEIGKRTLYLKNMGKIKRYNMILEHIDKWILSDVRRERKKEGKEKGFIHWDNTINIILRIILRENNPFLKEYYARHIEMQMEDFIREMEQTRVKNIQKKSMFHQKKYYVGDCYNITSFILDNNIIDYHNSEFMSILRLRDKFFQLKWENKLEIFNDEKMKKEIEDWMSEESGFYCKVFLKYRNINSYNVILKYLYYQNSHMENRFLGNAYKEIYYSVTYYLLNEITKNNFTVNQFKDLYLNEIIFADFGERLSNRLAEDIYVNNDLFQSGEIVKLLDKKERIYIVLYMLICHSIYDFREHWNNLNVKELHHLIPDTYTFREDVINNKEYLFNRLKISNMGHKLHTETLSRFVLYLKTPLTMELLGKIYEEKVIHPYYYLAIVSCVLGQRFMYFQSVLSKINTNVLSGLLTFLVKNRYLFKEEGIKNVMQGIFYISHNHFYKEQDLEWLIRLGLEELLILHPFLSEELIYCMRKSYDYVNHKFITYIFIYSCKYTLFLTPSIKKWIKERILRENVNDCKTIDEYIVKIQKTLIEFNWSLSLWEIETMKAFFQDSITNRY